MKPGVWLPMQAVGMWSHVYISRLTIYIARIVPLLLIIYIVHCICAYIKVWYWRASSGRVLPQVIQKQTVLGDPLNRFDEVITQGQPVLELS